MYFHLKVLNLIAPDTSARDVIRRRPSSMNGPISPAALNQRISRRPTPKPCSVINAKIFHATVVFRPCRNALRCHVTPPLDRSVRSPAQDQKDCRVYSRRRKRPSRPPEGFSASPCIQGLIRKCCATRKMRHAVFFLLRVSRITPCIAFLRPLAP